MYRNGKVLYRSVMFGIAMVGQRNVLYCFGFVEYGVVM